LWRRIGHERETRAGECDRRRRDDGGARSGGASGAFTSESLTQAFLDRIAIYNPAYNAILIHELQRGRRREVERRAAGKSLAPVDSVPIVVKDAMDMAGFPTTGGFCTARRAASTFILLPTRRSWPGRERPVR
jgi:amidase